MPARRRISSTAEYGPPPRRATSRSPGSSASPLTMRRPSRTAMPGPPSPRRSSVQSQLLALTHTGRTSTRCSRASRTICAGA